MRSRDFRRKKYFKYRGKEINPFPRNVYRDFGGVSRKEYLNGVDELKQTDRKIKNISTRYENPWSWD